jgi:hypothetical protein
VDYSCSSLFFCQSLFVLSVFIPVFYLCLPSADYLSSFLCGLSLSIPVVFSLLIPLCILSVPPCMHCFVSVSVFCRSGVSKSNQMRIRIFDTIWIISVYSCMDYGILVFCGINVFSHPVCEPLFVTLCGFSAHPRINSLCPFLCGSALSTPVWIMCPSRWITHIFVYPRGDDLLFSSLLFHMWISSIFYSPRYCPVSIPLSVSSFPPSGAYRLLPPVFTKQHAS